MTRHRLPIRPALTGVLLLVAAVATAAPVPVALERLVPDDPLLVAYAPSLDELEREVVGLARRFGASGPDEDESIFDLLEGISGDLGDLELVMDPTKPFAAVLRLAPGQMMPMFSMMVPLRAGLTPADVEERLGVAPLGTDDGYVALGTDVGYRPGGARQAMLAGLGDDDLTLRLDVEGLFVALGPMVDMMVQMAMQPPAEDGRPPRSDPERMDATLELLDVLRDGLGALEVAADIDGERVELGLGVRFREDGPLALGAQPSLDDVWADAALLDPTSTVLIASGVDLQNLRPLMESFVGIMKEFDDETYPAAKMIARMQQQVFEVWVQGLKPYVGSIHLADGKARYRWIEDDLSPAQTQQAMKEMLTAMDGLGIETTWSEPRSVAGFDAIEGDTRVDFDDLAALDPDAKIEADELATMESMFDVLLAPFTIAAGERKIVYAMDDDRAAVDAFLERVASSARGAVPARLAEARAWAGDDARGVMVLEVADYFAMFGAMAHSLGSDTADRGVLDAFTELEDFPSTPVYGSATTRDGWLRGRLSMEIDVLVHAVNVLKANAGND